MQIGVSYWAPREFTKTMGWERRGRRHQVQEATPPFAWRIGKGSLESLSER